MRNYKCLLINSFSDGPYELVPLRDEDKYLIMQWRNEQIYHLRQQKPLTTASQENYFATVVSNLFNDPSPAQLLFSLLENGTCIGYGGLVHIDRADARAEVSFIMNTSLEKDRFAELWTIYLSLLDKLAFNSLKLHKIFTYAFDLRPHLYPILESSGFTQEARLKDHCLFNSEFKDVIIHSKFNPHSGLYLRETTKSDADLLFGWSNDPSVRQNSLSSEEIPYETHLNWLDRQLESAESHLFILTDGKDQMGQVRIQLKENLWEIGYSIDVNHRGKKLGFAIVSLLMEKFPGYNFRAVVKKTNPASIKVFRNLGFTTQENSDDIIIFTK